MSRKDAARLIWIESFIAAATYEGYAKAGQHLGVDATTIRRRITHLEAWLHRILMFQEDAILTDDGDAFVADAFEIVNLIEKAGLKADLGKSTVSADGILRVEGEPLSTPETRKIGQLLLAHRADVSQAIPPAPRISGKDIDMDGFL